MLSYTALKHIHLTAIVLSLAGFVARFFLRVLESRWLNRKPVKIVPHVIDTILLLSAIAMLWSASINPLESAWLLAKIIGLVLYIVIAMKALKGKRSLMWGHFILALLCFAYIAGAAVHKSALSFLVAWF